MTSLSTLSTTISAIAIHALACPAQTVVVPSLAGSGPGQELGHALFFGNASLARKGLRAQMIYDTADLPQGSMTIRTLRVRRDSGPITNHPVTVQATIRMSTSANSFMSANPDFAMNHGPNLKTVFQGTITMPARSASSVWPSAWEAPIVLSTPFQFTKAPGVLVVDFATTGSSSSGAWRIECYGEDKGENAIDYAQSGCVSSSGSTANGRVNLSNLVPGGWFRTGYNPYPSNQPSLHTSIIVLGFGGSSSPGLPVSLASLGVPAAAGCMLAVSVGATLRATYYPAPPSVTHPSLGMVGMPNTVPIPNLATLAGAEFYSQALSVDVGPNGAPQLLASMSQRHRIGSGLGPLGAIVTRDDHLAATGFVSLKRVGVLRFN